MNTRIKKLRKALDLTQQEFADRLNIKRNTVATYETGKSNPSDAAVNLICREFRVNEEWLRTGKGEMFQPEPRDVLDELITKYNAPPQSRPLLEKFLKLSPEQQEAVVNYVREVAAALEADEYPDLVKPVPPGYNSRAELEAEADEFAAMAREQFLSEKIPGYATSFANDSDGGADGGYTAS